MLTDRIKTELYYLQSHWRLPGRPLVVIPIYSESLLNQDGAVHPPLVAMMQRFDSGYSHGVRINLGRVEDFLSTSFISKATFQNLEMSNPNNTRRPSDSSPSVSANQLPDIGHRRTSLKKTDQKVRYLPSLNRKNGHHSKCKRIIFCDQLNWQSSDRSTSKTPFPKFFKWEMAISRFWLWCKTAAKSSNRKTFEWLYVDWTSYHPMWNIYWLSWRISNQLAIAWRSKNNDTYARSIWTSNDWAGLVARPPARWIFEQTADWTWSSCYWHFDSTKINYSRFRWKWNNYRPATEGRRDSINFIKTMRWYNPWHFHQEIQKVLHQEIQKFIGFWSICCYWKSSLRILISKLGHIEVKNGQFDEVNLSPLKSEWLISL